MAQTVKPFASACLFNQASTTPHSTPGISPHLSPFACWWCYPLCRADPLLGFPTHEQFLQWQPMARLPLGPNGDSTTPAEAVVASSQPRCEALCLVGRTPCGVCLTLQSMASTPQCRPQIAASGQAGVCAPWPSTGSTVGENVLGSLRRPVRTRQLCVWWFS